MKTRSPALVQPLRPSKEGFGSDAAVGASSKSSAAVTTTNPHLTSEQTSSSGFEAGARETRLRSALGQRSAPSLLGALKEKTAERGVDVKELRFDLQAEKGATTFTLGVFLGPSTKREFVGRVDVYIDGENMGSPSLMALRPKFHGKGLGSFLHLMAAKIALDQSGAGYQSTILSSDAETAVWQNFQARGMATSETDSNKETVYTLTKSVLSDSTLKDLSLTLAGQMVSEKTTELPYPKDQYSMEELDIPSWSLR